MSADWLRDARTRLLDAPQRGCWLALIVRAIEPRTCEAGDHTERSPAHFLLGAWAPGADGLYPRLPEFAAIASPDATRALRELFVHLPSDARVLLVDEQRADAVLLAEMVLLCDSNLEPYQRECLEQFAARRRERLAETIRRRYTDREDGFERFRGSLPGAAGDPEEDAGGDVGGDAGGDAARDDPAA